MWNLRNKTNEQRERERERDKPRNEIDSYFFNVYLFLRQRQSVSRGGAERGGDTEYETGSRLRAISTEPDTGLELMNWEIMT